MKKRKIIIPSLLATASMPIVTLVGCGGQIPPLVNPQVIGGNTKLIGQVGKQSADIASWRLTSDGEFVPSTLSIAGRDKDKIKDKVFLNDGYVSWNGSLSLDTYYFNVKAVARDGSEFFSDDIVLYIGPTTNQFVTDDWDVVTWWANMGIDALHTVYKTECENNELYYGTLIGLQRKVILNSVPHNVIVVGEEQDIDENGKKVSLTFQFTNFVSGSDGAMATEWERYDGYEQPNNHNYWKSNLENTLNSEKNDVIWDNYDSEKQSVYSMIKNEERNKGLATNIKVVSRVVNTKLDSDWVPTQKNTKLFCPTLSNFFSDEGIDETDDIIIQTADIKKLYEQEGQPHILGINSSQYKYYAHDNNIGDEPIFKNGPKHFECLKLSPASNQNNDYVTTYYWISTPTIYNSDETAVWNVDPDGSMSNPVLGSFTLTMGTCIAPCFCI